ncbi:hypothetical protein D3C78_727710 [compost metagenome]
MAGVGLAEGAGEQLQQVQVFVGLGGDADSEVDGLVVAPLHALGEVQQAHAGALHQMAGVRSAVGNRDALAEISGTLRLAGLQPGEIALGDQSVLFQRRTEQNQRRLLVRRPLVHANLPGVQFEHRILSSPQPARGSRSAVGRLSACMVNQPRPRSSTHSAGRELSLLNRFTC